MQEDSNNLKLQNHRSALGSLQYFGKIKNTKKNLR